MGPRGGYGVRGAAITRLFSTVVGRTGDTLEWTDGSGLGFRVFWYSNYLVLAGSNSIF